MSKNNPENRGTETELRKYNGKKVKPVKYINMDTKQNFIAAAYEDGTVAFDANKQPIPYGGV